MKPRASPDVTCLPRGSSSGYRLLWRVPIFLREEAPATGTSTRADAAGIRYCYTPPLRATPAEMVTVAGAHQPAARRCRKRSWHTC